LQSHGFDYRVQKRFWNEVEDYRGKDTLSSSSRAVAGKPEAITRDYFRIILLSGQNDS
jgi:hypothetical protein